MRWYDEGILLGMEGNAIISTLDGEMNWRRLRICNCNPSPKPKAEQMMMDRIEGADEARRAERLVEIGDRRARRKEDTSRTRDV